MWLTRIDALAYLQFPLLVLQLLEQHWKFCEQLCPRARQAVPMHTPDEHWSLKVAELPSLQAVPLGSLAMHASDVSLHASEQSTSPSAPGHGLPA